MTNSLTSFATSTLSMSTREIAELTGKEHYTVLRDFCDVCEALEIGADSFAASYLSEQNKPTLMYELPKKLTTTLVSGYSIKMRHKIVERWMELEAAKPSFAIPTTLVEALRLALEGAEKLEAAMVQVESMKPAVEFVERLGCLRNILKIRDPTSSIPSRRSPRAPLGCPRMIEGGA